MPAGAAVIEVHALKQPFCLGDLGSVVFISVVVPRDLQLLPYNSDPSCKP